MGSLRLIAPLVALLGGACTGTITSGLECELSEDNAPPDSPLLMSPTAGSLEVTAETLAIETGAFSDADAQQTHAETEYELWLVAGDRKVERVWSAVGDDELTLTRATLTDGSFEAGFDGLMEWQTYGARARHRDDACQWSEWSELRTFRIDDGSTHLFAETVRDYYLDIPDESYQAIDAEALPPGCVPYKRNYYTGTVRFEGQTFPGSGLRVKGGCGSARTLDEKAAFKANLSWDDPEVPGCPETRRLHGLKRLTLNNQVQDRSFVHERLAYHFYKLLDVPTPRVAPAQVFVNDELWGLYLHVETIDRRFLSRWFDSNDGILYEGTYRCDLLPENVPDDEDGSGACFSKKFDTDACDSPDPGADPTTYEPLRELVAWLDGLPQDEFYPAVTERIDFDALLSLWAVDSIIGHWDGYNYEIINNYRIYHDPATDLWTIIPTGVDQTFKENLDAFAPAALLARRCVQEADCVAAFGERLREAVEVFESAGLVDMARDIQEQIRPYVAADPRKSFSDDDWENEVNATVSFVESRPEQIMQQLAGQGL